jgi:hypothetical protein
VKTRVIVMDQLDGLQLQSLLWLSVELVTAITIGWIPAHLLTFY